MIFTEAKVKGAYIIDIDAHADQRGFFARAWCEKEFAALGLAARIAQMNVSFNTQKGTLRGMHYQDAPAREAKVVSCTRGALYDVVLDLRPESCTYLKWDAAELTADSRRMLYVPEGCAHGFQTLMDNTEVLYLMSEFHSPRKAHGVRYDDSTFGIEWPLAVMSISDKDRTWPDYCNSAWLRNSEKS
jgi:dTDP-4-dehydrorhamnose 3,5-epimerase